MNAPPESLARVLEARGYALEEASDIEPPPLRVTDLSFARSEKRPTRKALADWRVAVAHSDPGVADGMAQTLRAQGAVAAVLSLSELGKSRIESLQPHVALVDPADLEGRGIELLLGIWSHRMLRWTPVLLTPVTCFDASGGADFNSMLASIDGLTVQTEDLMRQARNAESFTLPLSVYGPALTLRALVESGRTLSAHFVTPEINIDVDVAEGIVVGAQRHGDRSRILGPRALAMLTNQTAGQVRVERRDRPATTNIMAPLETALSAAAGESTSLPPPVNDTSLPAPALAQVSSPRPSTAETDEEEITRIAEMASLPKPQTRDSAAPVRPAHRGAKTQQPAQGVAATDRSIPPVGRTLLGMAPLASRGAKGQPSPPSLASRSNDASGVACVAQPHHEPGAPSLSEAPGVPLDQPSLQQPPAANAVPHTGSVTSPLRDAPTKTLLGAALGGLILLGIVIATVAGSDDAPAPSTDDAVQAARPADPRPPAVAAAAPAPSAKVAPQPVQAHDPALPPNPTPKASARPDAVPAEVEQTDEGTDDIGEDVAEDEGEDEGEGEDETADGQETSKGSSASDRASTLVNRGNQMMRAKRYGGARASYLKALELVPGYARAIEGMTQVHLARHEAGPALKMAKALVHLRPKRARNHRLLGDAYAANGDFAHAQGAWKLAARRGDRIAKKRLGM